MKCVLNVRGMRFALLLCPLCLAGGARGQPVPDPRGEPVPEVLTPPKLIEEVPPEYPAGASGSARVVLQLDVDERGAPGNLLVLSEPQPGFDESALAAARKLRFDPARRGGQPIAVRIHYAFNFAPPAAAQPPRPEELPVNLAGRIRERGTRRKLSGMEISAAGRSASTDREGRFELRGVPEGEPVEIVVAAPGYERFIARETIPPGQKLEVEYRLQALYSSPFEATIEGERERTEISRTTVSKEETERVPGAQGDSLKVVEDLPGVARTSPIGGGALVIRGSKPGDSVVYLDGEPIPLLYHFAALSSTFNPDLLEAIDFVPGNFSSRYGDLTGGLVEVRTRKLREEPHGYANLNLLEASALIEGAIPEVPGLSVALAGRRSYIDYILRAALSGNTDFSLTVAPRYYDAQLRVDWRPPDNPHSFSLLALTSDDALGFVLNRPTEQDPNLSGSIDAETGFQQIRLKHEWHGDRASITTVGMYERLLLSFDVGVNNLHLLGHDTYLRNTATYDVSDAFSLAGGLDIANRRAEVSAVFRQSFLYREVWSSRLPADRQHGHPPEDQRERADRARRDALPGDGGAEADRHDGVHIGVARRQRGANAREQILVGAVSDDRARHDQIRERQRRPRGRHGRDALAVEHGEEEQHHSSGQHLRRARHQPLRQRQAAAPDRAPRPARAAHRQGRGARGAGAQGAPGLEDGHAGETDREPGPFAPGRPAPEQPGHERDPERHRGDGDGGDAGAHPLFGDHDARVRAHQQAPHDQRRSPLRPRRRRRAARAYEGIRDRPCDHEAQAGEHQRRIPLERDADGQERRAPDHVQRTEGEQDARAIVLHGARSDAGGGRAIQPQADLESPGQLYWSMYGSGRTVPTRRCSAAPWRPRAADRRACRRGACCPPAPPGTCAARPPRGVDRAPPDLSGVWSPRSPSPPRAGAGPERRDRDRWRRPRREAARAAGARRDAARDFGPARRNASAPAPARHRRERARGRRGPRRSGRPLPRTRPPPPALRPGPRARPRGAGRNSACCGRRSGGRPPSPRPPSRDRPPSPR